MRPELLRVAGYVTMCPRSMASAEVLDRRREAVEKCETWQHRPDATHCTSTLTAEAASRLRRVKGGESPGSVSPSTGVDSVSQSWPWRSVVNGLADLTQAQRQLVDGDPETQTHV